jgi:IclR family transcriptional regulator, acetate operon repressor
MQLLGKRPDAALLEEFARTRQRGFSVSDGEVSSGATTIAAAILEVDGRPCAAIAVSAPSGRLPASAHARIGAMVSKAARKLSHGGRPLAN